MTTKELQTEILGDYVLIKKLGTGMLGEVFLAHHRFLKKPFVIKIFPEELSQNPGFIQRFEKEIGLLSTLEHPNIVKIQNISCAEGKYFLVTEAFLEKDLETLNLAQLLEKRKLAEEEIYSIIQQLAAGLDHAHEKNFGDEPLAHRALKLNNILIHSSNKQIQVKIADFGLSRIIGFGSILARTYKNLWEEYALKAGFKGSFENYELAEGNIDQLRQSFDQYYLFLAPELKGKNNTSRDLDAKADVYSFGIVAYFLLMGFFPEGIFPMPSEYNPKWKYNWDHLMQQCLQMDPEKRPMVLLDLIEYLKEKSEGPKPKLKPKELTRPEYESDPSTVFQTDKSVAIYKPKKTEIREADPIPTEMVVVEGGTFLRGCNHGARDEMPRHAVNLSSFAIDIHPITNEQFLLFLSAMGGEKDANNNDIIRLRDSRIRKNAGKLSIESGYSKHPIVGVTWYGAMAYAKWVGKRLPTEAEWEVAACGGLEGAQYPTGDDIERSRANFFNSDTTAVMSYPSNGYGIFDLAGNVYEWCMDWYGYHYYETSLQEPDNPTGPLQGVYRVLRGGCWKSLKEDMRCSHRHRNNPGSMNGTYGFRCATDVT